MARMGPVRPSAYGGVPSSADILMGEKRSQSSPRLAREPKAGQGYVQGPLDRDEATPRKSPRASIGDRVETFRRRQKRDPRSLKDARPSRETEREREAAPGVGAEYYQ
ncbi:hypothetical protein KM043_009418 [Ampulex compressa]|nr:hypothetical protein KM043_009418 [Ampulex compressa]